MQNVSFDGKGLNDLRKEYAPRIATFSNENLAREYGPLFETAPELLELCERLLGFAHHYGSTSACKAAQGLFDNARETIKRAKMGA